MRLLRQYVVIVLVALFVAGPAFARNDVPSRRLLLNDKFGHPIAAGGLNGTYPVPGPATGTRTATDTASLMAVTPWHESGQATLADETTLSATFGPENNRSSYADGQAWVGFAGADFTSIPVGSLIIVKDDDGYMAYGYKGAMGAGETLGSELVTNGDMETGDPPTGWSSAATSSFAADADAYAGSQAAKIVSNSANRAYIYQNLNVTANKLYRVNYYSKVSVGNTVCQIIKLIPPYTNQMPAITRTYAGSYGEFLFYFSPVDSTIQFTSRSAYNQIGSTLHTDSVSLKEVTAPASTAAYVYPYPGAPTTGWAGIASAFNMNDTNYTIEVYEPGASKLVVVSGKATPAVGDPRLGYSQTVTRTPNRAMIVGPIVIDDATKIVELGFDNDTSGTIGGNGLRITSDTIVPLDGGVAGASLGVPLDNTEYWFGVVLDAAGAHYYQRTGATWAALGDGGTDATATLYPAVSGNTAMFTLGEIIIPSELVVIGNDPNVLNRYVH